MIASRWRELWDLVSLAGALGAAVVALPFVAILSLGLFPYARRPGGPVLAAPLRVFLALLAAGELAAFVLAEWNRWRLTRLLTGLEHDAGAYGFLTVARHIEAMFTTEVVAAFAIVVAAPPLAIVILLRVWRRMDRGVRGRMCIAVSLAAWMLWVVALAAWALVFSQLLGFHVSPDERYELAVVSFGVPILARARSLVLGFAMLGTVVMLATRSGAARSRMPRGVGALGGVLLVLGGVACAATRGRADDARHPLSYVESAHLLVSVEVPMATQCRSASEGPILELAADGARLDGAPITLAGTTDILKAKRELWKITHSNGVLPTLGVAAPPSMARNDVLPFVDAARGVWDAGIDQIVAPRREAVITRTLGVLVRSTQFCSVPLPDVLAEGDTWGELSAALQRVHD